MRISVLKDDPGYRADTPRFDVWMDGVQIEELCVTADEEQGEALVHVRGKDGKVLIDGTGQKVLTAIVRGKVEIRERAHG